MMRIVLAFGLTLVIALFTHFSAQASVTRPVCRMVSEGIYNGTWVKHRILIQEAIAFGANDLDSILSQLEVLRDEGLCR